MNVRDAIMNRAPPPDLPTTWVCPECGESFPRQEPGGFSWCPRCKVNSGEQDLPPKFAEKPIHPARIVQFFLIALVALAALSVGLYFSLFPLG